MRKATTKPASNPRSAAHATSRRLRESLNRIVDIGIGMIATRVSDGSSCGDAASARHINGSRQSVLLTRIDARGWRKSECAALVGYEKGTELCTTDGRTQPPTS